MSLYHRIKNILENIFVDFWHKLARSTRWFFFMWTNNNWDYLYLFRVMDKKMGEIEKTIVKYGHYHNSPRYAKTLQIARWYLQRLIKDDRVDKLMDKFNERYGDWKMIMKDKVKEDGTRLRLSEWVDTEYSKCKSKEKNEHAKKVFSRIVSLDHYLYKKYYNKFMYIFAKHSESWSD